MSDFSYELGNFLTGAQLATAGAFLPVKGRALTFVAIELDQALEAAVGMGILDAIVFEMESRYVTSSPALYNE